ncbi:phage holin, LLH family [Paenibacillus sp. QZ-Y1]|uniref:phage holin, LLH family n=1 Tax=Paenibacillus sp. QZ-Y1 TaxID=3414511 RepID=UPI003F7AE59F
MDNLYIIAIILAAVVGGLFVIPYVKGKGWINKDKTEGVQQTLMVARLVLDAINVKGLDKNKASFALDIADTVVEYVDEYMDDNVDKKEVSLNIVRHLLEKYGITPTESERQLIEIAIAEAIERSSK